jgi:hypothetical protein
MSNMHKIFLVMENFYHWTDEYYAYWKGVCGRPEKIFIDKQEAQTYCNYLNSITIPVHLSGHYQLDIHDRVGNGFYRLENGTRDDFWDEEAKLSYEVHQKLYPFEGSGYSFWDSDFSQDAYTNPYTVVEVECANAESILAFNDVSVLTYQQCHEISQVFGLRSAMETGFPEYRTLLKVEEEYNRQFIEWWELQEARDDGFKEGRWERQGEEWGFVEGVRTQEEEFDTYRHLPQPPFAWASLHSARGKKEIPDA